MLDIFDQTSTWHTNNTGTNDRKNSHFRFTRIKNTHFVINSTSWEYHYYINHCPSRKLWNFFAFCKFRWKKSVLESLFNKVGVLRACNFIKEDSDTCFFCEIYKLFKDNYFEEHLWTSASKHYLKRDSNSGAFLWIL